VSARFVASKFYDSYWKNLKKGISVDPRSLLIPGARWTPGCWSPSRCEWYRQASPEVQLEIMAWISKEGERKKCHRTHLPDNLKLTSVPNDGTIKDVERLSKDMDVGKQEAAAMAG